jgi:hypothetical protein
MPNVLCHFEIQTDDPDRCKAFYSSVFDWKFEATPGHPDYTMINTGAKPDGGMMKRPPNCPTPMLGVYILVDDIEQTLAKVMQGGGRVVVPKTPIPGFGAFAIFLDPENIPVGIFQR